MPIELITSGKPAAVCLYGAIAAMGGSASDGCSIPIAALGFACGISHKVVRRELGWLAHKGWITDEYKPGYTTVRRIAVPADLAKP
jgi:hypothetical protein